MSDFSMLRNADTRLDTKQGEPSGPPGERGWASPCSEGLGEATFNPRG